VRKGIIAVVALLAGAGLAVPLSSSGASSQSTTVITTCPPGQGAPYCEISTVTTPDETTTTTTTAPPSTTSTSPSENPPSEPVAGETVVAGTVTGTVLVRIPGTNRFVEVQPGQPIPLGSEIDVTNGSIELTSAPDANGNVQKAVFSGGTFKVTQIRDTGSSGRATGRAAAVRLITRLTLVDSKPKRCGKSSPRAKAQVPHLWGNGKGRFQTKGAYSAATVSGTKWYVGNRCDGTYTRVARGVVSVRDHTRHKTVTVRAPHTYLARPPKKH
jgi:hypothetical protein